jgi:hypothetical protein
MKENRKLQLIGQAKNEYMKSWRAKNPNIAKAYADRYWLKKGED